MEAIGFGLDVESLRARQDAAEARELRTLEGYAAAIGSVTIDQLQETIADRQLTVGMVEERLSRERDYPGAIRLLWDAWHTPAMLIARAKSELATVPSRLLEPAAVAALAGCPEIPRRVAASYDPEAHGALVLTGESGKGKSLSMAQAALRLASAGRRGIRWYNVSKLVQALRSHRYGHGDCPEVHDAIHARWLILDELGWEQGEPTALLDVLSARYDMGRVTCATSGLTEAELKARYGDALLRRITESNKNHRGNVTSCSAKK